MDTYRDELRLLQTELVRLQSWVAEERERLLIIFEGRDTAGKGGAILRFSRFLNPRAMRVVALPKPTETEKGQWFFQRYVQELPNPGEIVFFDRSWYNRAVVEPVMGFCTHTEYRRFLRQVPEFEYMLHEDGLRIIKFWFSINIQEQQRRLKSRATNPLKQWKLSTTDLLAQQHWNDFTRYKERMFAATHRTHSPWVIVEGNDKQRARLEAIRHVLASIDYDRKGETGVSFACDPQVLRIYDGPLSGDTGHISGSDAESPESTED